MKTDAIAQQRIGESLEALDSAIGRLTEVSQIHPDPLQDMAIAQRYEAIIADANSASKAAWVFIVPSQETVLNIEKPDQKSIAMPALNAFISLSETLSSMWPPSLKTDVPGKAPEELEGIEAAHHRMFKMIENIQRRIQGAKHLSKGESAEFREVMRSVLDARESPRARISSSTGVGGLVA